jgi:hypothetical protein
METKETRTIVELGYYHPSNANWNYRIWLLVDKTGVRLYRETFGGDSRLVARYANEGITIEKLSGGRGTGVQYKWKDISKLPDLEGYNGKNWGEDSPA